MRVVLETNILLSALINRDGTPAQLTRLPAVERSTDPADNFLLAMAEAGKANYLVSGDRRGVLELGTHGITQILRAREFLDVLGIKPIADPSTTPINKPR